MVFFAFTVVALLLSLRSLLLLLTGKRVAISLFSFVFYLCLALPLAGNVFSSLKEDSMAKAILAIVLAAAVSYSYTRKVKEPQEKFSWKEALFPMGFFVLGIIVLSLNAIDNLTGEKPILKIRLTGKQTFNEVTWKTPKSKWQKSTLPYYEVVLEAIDGKELQRFSLSGELCAVRAKIFRFHPLLNALGIPTKYKLDLLYSGYRNAERYAEHPVEAHSLASLSSPWDSLIFKYWESFFCRESTALWIKSAILQSNYFPLTDAQGEPLQQEYYLTLSPSGLSSLTSN
jgi:hypothetical protein